MHTSLKLLFMFLFFMGNHVAFASEQTYINGIDSDYLPFSYVDKNGQASGFDIDALNWVAKEMGFKVEHKAVIWSIVIPTLTAKDIDLIASAMSITPNRSEQVTFSNPYGKMPKVYVVKSDSSLTINDIQQAYLRLGAQRGTNEAKIAREEKLTKNYRYTLRFYSTTPLAIEELLENRIDVVAIAQAQAQNAINKGKPIKIIGEYSKPDFLAVAMRHEDTKLHEIINEGYKRLMADPYWEKLKARHFMVYPH